MYFASLSAARLCCGAVSIGAAVAEVVLLQVRQSVGIDVAMNVKLAVRFQWIPVDIPIKPTKSFARPWICAQTSEAL